MNRFKWIVPPNTDSTNTGITHGNTKAHIFETDSGNSLCKRYSIHTLSLSKHDEIDNFDWDYVCKRCLKKASPEGEMFCRRCGCDWLHACDGGCMWVEEGLCSACISEKDIRRLKNDKSII
ncbi:hypothetical protein [Erysipelothrix aquatica]|uniref:hypothetical protein n=1 Tax=Erysipelothrix aquatica TaxID=2683714 RepID=UPI00135674A8|nr:hypothetical protein [Erysipelothrix aquatica]